jgi:hypothetical protein
LYGTSFDTPDAHFDKLCLFGDAQSGDLKSPKSYYDCKELKKTQTGCHEKKQQQQNEGSVSQKTLAR